MTDLHEAPQERGTERSSARSRGHRHNLMMIACCIPMLLIAIVLVLTGIASSSFLLFAVMCPLMMALMMRGMGGMGHDGHHT
jgi:hypothetical protein